MVAKFSSREQSTGQDAAVLGDERRQRDAVDPHAEPDDEHKVEDDVDDVHRQHDRQRAARVLHADQPADEHEVA